MLLTCSSGWQVTQLLGAYLEKYALHPVFTEEEVEHYLMPVEDVVDSYVVEAAGQPAVHAGLSRVPHAPAFSPPLPSLMF